MDFAQHVTVKEYFKTSMAQQKDFLNLRWKFARDYMVREKLAKDGLDTVRTIKEIAAARKTEIGLVIREYARRQIFYLILTDMLEFSAESGIATLQARYDDYEAEKTKTSKHRYSNMEILWQITELCIVPSIERPLAIVNDSDLFPPNYSVLKFSEHQKNDKVTWEDLTKAPFDTDLDTAKLSDNDYKQSKIDYDSMSEEEWQATIAKKAAADAAILKLHGGNSINFTPNNITDAEEDYQRRIIDKYKAINGDHDGLRDAARYLSPIYPDWIDD